MNSTLSKVLIFAAGAAAGVACTWKYFKTKYERIAQDEIDQVVEQFSKREKEEPTEEDISVDEQIVRNEADEKEYHDELVKLGYTNYADIQKDARDRGIYVLDDPRQFSDEDYEVASWSYYKDNVLADENDDIVEDIDRSIGIESLQHFGAMEDEPDMLYVRNDKLKLDFEVLKVDENYYDLYPDRKED